MFFSQCFAGITLPELASKITSLNSTVEGLKDTVQSLKEAVIDTANDMKSLTRYVESLQSTTLPTQPRSGAANVVTGF